MAPSRPTVTVLLATRNCAPAIDAQIAGFLNQGAAHVRLVLRDERSTDGTWERVRAWRPDGRVLMVRASARSARTRPLQMMALVEGGVETVALARQCDHWLPDAMERGLRALARAAPNRPALHFARAALSDASSGVTHATPVWPTGPGFGNALVENIVTGGAILLNGAAVGLLKFAGFPHGAVTEPWWCYLVVSAFGDVTFDPGVTVVSRRTPSDPADAFPFPQADDAAFMTKVVGQARAFLRHYGSHPGLAPEKRRLVSILAHGSRMERRALAFERRIWRQFTADDLAIRSRMLAGRWPQARPLPSFAPVRTRVGYVRE